MKRARDLHSKGNEEQTKKHFRDVIHISPKDAHDLIKVTRVHLISLMKNNNFCSPNIIFACEALKRGKC